MGPHLGFWDWTPFPLNKELPRGYVQNSLSRYCKEQRHRQVFHEPPSHKIFVLSAWTQFILLSLKGRASPRNGPFPCNASSTLQGGWMEDRSSYWDTSAMCLWRKVTHRSSSSSSKTSLTRESPMPLVSYLERGESGFQQGDQHRFPSTSSRFHLA